MNDNFSNTKEAFGKMADKILLEIQNQPVKKIYQTPQPQAESPAAAQLLKVIASCNGIIRDMVRNKNCDNCIYKADIKK